MAQVPPFDKEDMRRRMKGAVATVKHEFAGLRTGRANTAILDPVHVDAYGSSMPLAQVGTINAPEPRLLTVQVWERAWRRRPTRPFATRAWGSIRSSTGSSFAFPSLS